MSYSEEKLAQFAERYVVQPDGCWLWQGRANSSGYGAFSLIPGRSTGAHRASYMIHKGPVPKGMEVCHTCDVPLCVNPEHLFLGTKRDNMQDCLRKGRFSVGDRHREALARRDFAYGEEHARRTREKARRGEQHVHAKLTEELVHEIRFGKYKNLPQDVVGAALGISQSNVCMIRKYRTWRHLP